MVAAVGTPGAADPTSGTSASTTKSPGAPAAVADGTMLMGMLVVGSAVNPGTTAPNWTVKYNSNAVASGLTVLAVLWRRSTGTEPTPYSWSTGSGAGQSVAQIWPIEGELASGDPFHSSSDFKRATATSAVPTVGITALPKGSTLFWACAAGSARTLGTGPSIDGVPMTRLTPTGAQLYHLFKLEDYTPPAGAETGDPSVSGLTQTGGNSSQTAGMWAVLAEPAPNEATFDAAWAYAATVDSVMPEVGVSEASFDAAWSYAAAVEATTTRQATLDAAWEYAASVEGPVGAVEYVEDWTDLNDVNDTGVQVIGNKLYATGGTLDRGYVKAFDFPVSGIWRQQQLIYNVDAGLQNPTIKLGITTGDPATGIIDDDPNAVGIAMEFATRARSSFKGSALSSVPIQDEQIVGVGPSIDATLLFDITADETFISFSLKDVVAVREMIAFRIARSDLAAAGKTVTGIYAFFTDARTTAGSSLSPFIIQVGSIGPTDTKVVAGQQIEGRGQRIITTKQNDAAPMEWWAATPPNMTDDTPVIIHCPQSLTGDGHDAWTDTRMEPITAAVMADYIWLSSTDTEDRFGNQVELDNYDALLAWLEDHFGGGRDVFLFGTSMGTMVCVNLLGRGVGRALAVIGFAGGFDWLWNNVTEKRPEIIAAFGVASDGSDLREKTTGYDPLLDFIGDPDFDGKGFRFYTGSSDSITPTELSNDMSTIALAAGATEADVIEGTGGHLDSSQYHGDEVVAFYERNASPNQATFDATWTYSAAVAATATRTADFSAAWVYAADVDALARAQAILDAAWVYDASIDAETIHEATFDAAWEYAAAVAAATARQATFDAAWEYDVSDVTALATHSAELDAGWAYDAAIAAEVTRRASIDAGWVYTAEVEASGREGAKITAGWSYGAALVAGAVRRAELEASWSYDVDVDAGAAHTASFAASWSYTAAVIARTARQVALVAAWAYTATVEAGTTVEPVRRVTIAENLRTTIIAEHGRTVTIREADHDPAP